jgi:hypothetical protein
VYVGVALWPGGTIEEWGPVLDTDTQLAGLNPCNTTNDWNNTGLSDQAYLASKGVVFATYEMQVDTLMVLRINYTDTLPLFQSINNNDLPNVLSAVIFRSGFRSEPRYVISESEFLTKGLGAVPQLAGNMVFSKGQLQYLHWFDLTCNKCGGLSNSKCIQATPADAAQHSCAIPLTGCGTSLTNGSAPQDCSLQIYMGFTGGDRYSSTFNSGWEIQRLNAFSVASLFDNAKQQLTTAISSNENAFINGGGATSSTPAQGDNGAA